MSSPPDASDDGSNVASSNHTLLYIIVAVLIGVMLYVVVRYGRSVLAEYRQLQAGHGAGRGARFGLSAEEIAALPTFTYRVRAASASPHPPHGGDRDRRRRRSGSKGRGATAVDCVVCLQELEDGDVVRVLPSCRHFFHGGCIDVWLQEHTTCPVCRADLEPECDRLAEAAAVTSPPLPQLRRCGVSPERPSPSRVLADILSRSPLRSPSPGPMAYARVDDQWAKTPSPARLSEIRVVRSKTPSPIRFSKQHLSPSPRGIGVLESGEVITSASSAPVVPEIVIARSMTPSPTRLNRQLSARSNDVVIPLTPPSPSTMTIGEGGGGSLSKSSSPVHN